MGIYHAGYRLLVDWCWVLCFFESENVANKGWQWVTHSCVLVTLDWVKIRIGRCGYFPIFFSLTIWHRLNLFLHWDAGIWMLIYPIWQLGPKQRSGGNAVKCSWPSLIICFSSLTHHLCAQNGRFLFNFSIGSCFILLFISVVPCQTC